MFVFYFVIFIYEAKGEEKVAFSVICFALLSLNSKRRMWNFA